jgi:hypothetical protein
MIYSPITLPIIWRCRVRVEYPGTVGLVVRHLCMSLALHARPAAQPGVRRQRRCSSQQQSCVDRRAALVFRVGHTSPSPLRSFASVIAQMVDALSTDVPEPCRDPQATDTGVDDSGIHSRWPGAAVQAVA